MNIICLGICLETHLLDKIQASLCLRFENFGQNLTQWKQYPVIISLIGYGIAWPRGCSGLAINQDPTILSDHFQFVLCLGIPGLIFMVYVWFKFFKNFKIAEPESLAILTLFVFMFVEYPFQIARCWHLIVVVLAFKLIKHEQERIS